MSEETISNKTRLILALGDLLALVLFVYAGQRDHRHNRQRPSGAGHFVVGLGIYFAVACVRLVVGGFSERWGVERP